MSNYSTLKAAISAVIKENNNHEITGQVLQTTLLAMVDSLAGGYLFKGIATPATVVGTPDENVFYIGGGGLYSNFGATPVHVPDGCIGIFTYNGSFENHIIPTGGVFDISAYNAVGGTPATYANLQAALGTNGANIPEALRKGGMSVKFVQENAQSSDNKYVQYRLMSDSFNTTLSNWQGVDDEPTAISENLVKSGGVLNYIYNNVFSNENALSSLQNTLELGYISGLGAAGDRWSYSSTDTSLRTKQGTYINLGKGDIIKLTDYTNVQMYVGCFEDGRNGSNGWITRDFVIPAAGNYVVILTIDFEQEVTVEGLGSRLQLKKMSLGDAAYKSIDNTPIQRSENLVTSGGVAEITNYIKVTSLSLTANKIYNISGVPTSINGWYCTELFRIDYIKDLSEIGISLKTGSANYSINANIPSAVFFDANYAFVGALFVEVDSTNKIAYENIPNGSVYCAFNLYRSKTMVVNGYGINGIKDAINLSTELNIVLKKNVIRWTEENLITNIEKAYGENGSISSVSTFGCSDLIPLDNIIGVNGGITIYSGSTTHSSGAHLPDVLFFDATKTIISYLYTVYGEGDTIEASDIPANAKYIAFNSLKNGSLVLDKFGLVPLYNSVALLKASIPSIKNSTHLAYSQRYIVWSQWNVGQFGGGAGYTTITPANYNSRVLRWNNEVADEFANVFGLIEYNPVFGEKTSGVNVSPDNVVWNNYQYKAVFRQEPAVSQYYGGNAINSKFPLSNAAKHMYDCFEGVIAPDHYTQNFIDHVAFYTEADMEYMGVTIKVVECSVPFNFTTLSDNTYQRMAYSELAEKFKDYPFVIISGDMECVNRDDYDIFTDEGFTLCNGGDFGWFDTCITPIISSVKQLDNIIVKGFNVIDVRMSDSNLSDHFPLIATLEPYMPEPTE